MGWHINEVENTVIINEQIIDEFVKSGVVYYRDYDDQIDLDDIDYDEFIDDDGCIIFNDDDMEHMDFISKPIVQQILCNHKVEGDICFSSNDGDNAGCMWGYRFDGKGGMVKLYGKITWHEDEPPARHPHSKSVIAPADAEVIVVKFDFDDLLGLPKLDDKLDGSDLEGGC